jgi:hypothetical protein
LPPSSKFGLIRSRKFLIGFTVVEITVII